VLKKNRISTFGSRIEAKVVADREFNSLVQDAGKVSDGERVKQSHYLVKPICIPLRSESPQKEARCATDRAAHQRNIYN
jgi:hypothetical protein